MKATTTSERHTALADIHRMKNVLCMTDEDWRTFLAQWRVESSKELTNSALHEVRLMLHGMTDSPTDDERTRWMRRVWSVVGSWLRANGWKNDNDAIRTVVCRAARKKSTREITLGHLKQIYYAWRAKSEQTATAQAVKQSLDITSLN